LQLATLAVVVAVVALAVVVVVVITSRWLKTSAEITLAQVSELALRKEEREKIASVVCPLSSS